MLTDWAYRSLNVDLARSGYRTSEPNAIKQRELSILIPRIFEALKNDGIKKSDIAKKLNIPIQDMNQLFFNLTLTSMPTDNFGGYQAAGSRPQLRIIK